MRIFLIAVLIAGLCSCKQEKSSSSADCQGPAKSFTTDVQPILQRTCNDDSGCHGSGSANGPGALLNYSQVYNSRTSIRSAISSGVMPQNGSLTAFEKNAIFCWIESGAPNN